MDIQIAIRVTKLVSNRNSGMDIYPIATGYPLAIG